MNELTNGAWSSVTAEQRAGMMSSATPEWGTPQGLYDELDEALGPFDLDPCATDLNHKCERYFTKATNGLAQSWKGARVYMNPPYGRGIGKWVEKAATEPDLAVCLLPARTDTAWWHRFCMTADEIWFVRGRVRFDGATLDNAPFPSAVVVFSRRINKPQTRIRSWKPAFGQAVLDLEESA